MKILHVVVSKGPDDFGVWIEELAYVTSAGETIEEVVSNLKEAISLYIEYKKDLPDWLVKGDY